MKHSPSIWLFLILSAVIMSATKKILQKAFTGRKIIQINVEELNEGGGGIHCATQQQQGRE